MGMPISYCIYSEISEENTAVSHDGTRIALGYVKSVGEKQTVYIDFVDVSTGKQSRGAELTLGENLSREDVTDNVGLSFSPNDRSLAVACSGRIWSVDLTGAREPLVATVAQKTICELTLYCCFLLQKNRTRKCMLFQ